jgi:excisionase family DNA binding protein
VDRLLNLQDAAAALAVSQDFLKKLYRSNRLRIVKLGRAVRVPEEEVNRLMREGVPRARAR